MVTGDVSNVVCAGSLDVNVTVSGATTFWFSPSESWASTLKGVLTPTVTLLVSWTSSFGVEMRSPAGTEGCVIGDVAEMLAVPGLTPVMEKYAELLPARTVTVAGIVRTVGSDDVSVT